MYNIRALCFVTLILVLAGCVSVAHLPPDEERRLDSEIENILTNRPATQVDDQPVTLPDNIFSEAGFIWPLRNTVLSNMSESGINIKATGGEPVRAVKSGMVTFVSDRFEGYGKVIIVKHQNGFTSLYAYNSEIMVKLNQVVKQGDIIAKAGQSGRAEQPQLHFRLFLNEKPVNPMKYLP